MSAVVIGYEPTEQGEDALALGAIFADVLGSSPVVATVIKWPGNILDAGDLDAALEQETAAGFALARERLRAWSPQTVALANPSPSNALYALAQESGAGVVVVGSTHRGGLGRTFLGNVGRALSQGAPCGVAVAPRAYASRSEHHLARIGVAYDGSEESNAALETVVHLADRLHSGITLLTVAEAERYGLTTAVSILTTAEFHEFEREEKQRTLDAGLARVPERLAAEGQLLSGAPAPLLAEAAAGLDLLVLGSRGYGPVRQTLLGSTSAAVMDLASCPVLILPRGAGSDPLGLTRS